MTNLAGYAGGGGGAGAGPGSVVGSQAGGQEGPIPSGGPGGPGGMGARGMSTYSLATTNHPLAEKPEISMSSDPTDEEVRDVLKRYLATQDLMRV